MWLAFYFERAAWLQRVRARICYPFPHPAPAFQLFLLNSRPRLGVLSSHVPTRPYVYSGFLNVKGQSTKGKNRIGSEHASQQWLLRRDRQTDPAYIRKAGETGPPLRDVRVGKKKGAWLASKDLAKATSQDGICSFLWMLVKRRRSRIGVTRGNAAMNTPQVLGLWKEALHSVRNLRRLGLKNIASLLQRPLSCGWKNYRTAK